MKRKGKIKGLENHYPFHVRRKGKRQSLEKSLSVPCEKIENEKKGKSSEKSLSVPCEKIENDKKGKRKKL
jgi:hypothetical protein